MIVGFGLVVRGAVSGVRRHKPIESFDGHRVVWSGRSEGIYRVPLNFGGGALSMIK